MSASAGIAFVSAGRVLLLRRSESVDKPGLWAFPGGGIEENETALTAALREVKEELGVELPSATLVFEDGHANFSLFTANVDSIQPQLNDEHDGYVWAKPDDLPQPLHPGTEELVRKVMNNDFIGDSALAFDKSVRTYDQDGRLRVEMANISKSNICGYLGAEIPDHQALNLDPKRLYMLFRAPEELEKSAATFNGIPLLNTHVPSTAWDHPKGKVVGTTGTESVFEEPYLRNSLVVWTGDAIEGIESNKQRELSPGYRYRADMTPGVFNGESYDGVMRDIQGNHLALVEEGRTGSDVIVGDSALEIPVMFLSRCADGTYAMDSGDWDEGKHPRGEGGRFGKGSGGEHAEVEVGEAKNLKNRLASNGRSNANATPNAHHSVFKAKDAGQSFSLQNRSKEELKAHCESKGLDFSVAEKSFDEQEGGVGEASKKQSTAQKSPAEKEADEEKRFYAAKELEKNDAKEDKRYKTRIALEKRLSELDKETAKLSSEADKYDDAGVDYPDDYMQRFTKHAKEKQDINKKLFGFGKKKQANDSKFFLNSSTTTENTPMKTTALSKKAVLAKGALMASVRLAADAKLDLNNILSGVTHKNWEASKVKIADAIKPLLAADADISDVVRLLDHMDDEEALDELALDEEIDDEDEETDEEKAARLKKEKAEMGTDTPEPKPSAKGGKEEFVSKAAMDAAVRSASDSATAAAVQRLNAIRDAEEAVKPFVGKLAMSFDSADGVYKAALETLGVDVKGVHPDSYRFILGAQKKPGEVTQTRMAKDAAPVAGFSERFPTVAAVRKV